MFKQMYKEWVSSVPTDKKQEYIFLTDYEDIAKNMTMLEYRVLYLQRDSKQALYYTLKSFMKDFNDLYQEMLKNGKYIENGHINYLNFTRFHYVCAMSTVSGNEELTRFFEKQQKNILKDEDFKFYKGWMLFKEKEYLGKFNYQEQLEEILSKFITRYEGEKTDSLDFSTLEKKQFHRYNNKDEPVGAFDKRIVDFIIESVHFFILNGQPYIYQEGVFKLDVEGVELKDIIQNMLFDKFVKSSTINNIYNLLISQKSVVKKYEEINKHPKHWINFKNGMFDCEKWKIYRHSPEFMSINQIPHYLKVDDIANAKNQIPVFLTFINFAIPNEQDQMMLFEYLAYCMTIDTRFQKFLMLTGDGGTGKSIIVSLIQNIVGQENYSTVNPHQLAERFYPSQLLGKLLDACADISSLPMQEVDTLKKATGEDMLFYEQKGKDGCPFFSYAKLLFSANEMPLNLDEKTNAFYRRMLVLKMNRKPEKEDSYLKEKIMDEIEYIILFLISFLRKLYRDNAFSESTNSKNEVERLYRNADSIKAFLDECTVRKDGELINRVILYNSYEEYCDSYGRKPCSPKSFYKSLEDRGYPNVRKANGRYTQGISLKEEDFVELDKTEQMSLPF